MLPLYGMALAMRGFGATEGRQVLRLRSPNLSPVHSADLALIRCDADFAIASSSGFSGMFVVGDSWRTVTQDPMTRVVQVEQVRILG